MGCDEVVLVYVSRVLSDCKILYFGIDHRPVQLLLYCLSDITEILLPLKIEFL